MSEMSEGGRERVAGTKAVSAHSCLSKDARIERGESSVVCRVCVSHSVCVCVGGNKK